MRGDPRKAMPQPPAWACTTPQRVARAAVHAILHNRRLVVVTAAARLAWTLKRFTPGLLDYLMREGWRKGKKRRASAAAKLETGQLKESL
jgi:short-subunit dehydrogenase